MNNLQIFKNANFGEVRTILTEDNEVLFCAKDVASSLGYKNTNKAIKDHCKRGSLIWGNDTLGRQQQVKYIPESDVFRLATNSKLPQAEQFETWIFEEVLPSIRKNGGYLTPSKIEEIINNPDTIIQLAVTLKQEREKSRLLELENEKQKQLLIEAQPKVNYYDLILKSKEAIAVNIIAKDYGINAVKFNEILKEYGIQYKCGKTWVLREDYANQGYTTSVTVLLKNDNSTVWTCWTQKGRLFLYNFLKEKGILPLIERDENYVVPKENKVVKDIISDFPENWEELYTKYVNKKITSKDIIEKLGITKNRFYNMLKKYRKNI